MTKRAPLTDTQRAAVAALYAPEDDMGETAPTHANVYCALAAAQAEFSAPKKDAVNPAFRSKYADLSSVVEAVAPALSRHGVAFFHEIRAENDGRAMVTALVHGPSQTRVECAVPLIVGKNDMQGFKSATTYAKRIGLESVTGVAPDDDDGNDAAKNPPKPTRRPAVSDDAPHPTRSTVPDERFETEDGAVKPKGSAPYTADDTPAQRARKAADGIVTELLTAKTVAGLDGVWSRNEGVIRRLGDSYEAEHGDVLAAYTRRKSQIEADVAA
jgi:hypothetical protein